MGTREVQSCTHLFSWRNHQAKLYRGYTWDLARLGAPLCQGRCYLITLVFSFSYPCQVFVHSLTFLQRHSLKSRHIIWMNQCLQTDSCSVTPGSSRDEGTRTSGERGDRQARLSFRETSTFLAPSCPQLWSSVLLLVYCNWHLYDSSSLSHKTEKHILFSWLPSLFHSLPTKPTVKNPNQALADSQAGKCMLYVPDRSRKCVFLKRTWGLFAQQF